MRRGLLGDGEFQAFEDGRLGALGHAVVFDIGLETVECVDLGVGADSWSLEVAKQAGCLLVHGCRCRCRCLSLVAESRGA